MMSMPKEEEKNYIKDLNADLMFCSFIMFLKIFITLIIQGSNSGKAGTRTIEDAAMTKGEVTEENKENDLRWKRIAANDLETIPFSFIIFWGARSVV